jgi:aspartate/methionine/tyrosine aminotransferase
MTSPTAARELPSDVLVLSTGDVRLPCYRPAAARPRLADQHYRGAQGEPELRAAIASKDRLKPDQLLITPGARQALLLAFASLPADRREILLPRPYWASYPALAGTVGAALRVVDTERLEASVGPATGAVLINSPRNPDGAVLDADRLSELVAWTGAAGLLLIFDQVYRGVPLPGPAAPSPLELPGGLPPHCLVVDGLAKSHALAGLRIGWLAAAPTVLAPITALASHLVGGTSSAAQDAALVALQAGRSTELGRRLADNRDYGAGRLNRLPGVRCPVPDGGIFLFPDLTEWLGSAELPDLVGWLEREHRVAVVDGAAFGAPGHVRLSFAVPAEQFRLGIRRLAKALESR